MSLISLSLSLLDFNGGNNNTIRDNIITANGSDGQGIEGWPVDQVDLSLDVSSSVQATLEAFNCHQTQFGGEDFIFQLPESELEQMLSREYFALGRPESTDVPILDDLFVNSA